MIYDTIMRHQIVMDTNVLVSALRSRRGASFRLLSLIGEGGFETHVSVPLVVEYEDAGRRALTDLPLNEADLDAVLDYLVQVAQRHEIFFLWRPFLKDPKDDMVLELAVQAQCTAIVTHNLRDFAQVEKRFGVRVMSPSTFLKEMEEQ